MDKALDSALTSKPFIHGMLCADVNGLAIAAKGELSNAPAGRYVSLSRLASSINPDQPPPTVLIETQNRNIIVRDYDSMTIVMCCARTED